MTEAGLGVRLGGLRGWRGHRREGDQLGFPGRVWGLRLGPRVAEAAPRLGFQGQCVGEVVLGATAGMGSWCGWDGGFWGAHVTLGPWPLLTFHLHLVSAVFVATQPTVLTAVALLGDTPEEAAAAVTEGGLAEGDLVEGVQEGQAQLGADGAGPQQVPRQLLSAEGTTPLARGRVKPVAGKGEVA